MEKKKIIITIKSFYAFALIDLRLFLLGIFVDTGKISFRWIASF